MNPPSLLARLWAWIGIDVSKHTLDACLLKANGKRIQQIFPNDPAGFAKLLRWVLAQAPDASLHFCLEATGAYSEGIALFLAEARQVVSVINPYRARHFALGQGQINKTDAVDARTLADYARKENPPPWRMSVPEVRHLLSLLRRYQSLQEHLQQEQNRLGVPGLVPEVACSLKESLRFLKQQMERLYEQIRQHIDQHPSLRADKELLESIPGIGELTAFRLLAELPDVQQFANAAAVGAYAGLNPCEYRSGTSVHQRTRIRKAGNVHLRRALYMPALAAARYNPVCRQLYERLVARGKSRMAALCAVMRKLLMIAYGVLKSRRTFTLQVTEDTA